MNPLRCLNVVLILLSTGLVSVAAASGNGRLVSVGNLVYAGDKTSVCFSDRFLTTVETESGINTEKRMHAVRLANVDELFATPFVIMNGQGDFRLREDEKKNLEQYLRVGGFLLASAGCSSQEWSAAFRREVSGIFGADSLRPVPKDHAFMRTLFQLPGLHLKGGGSPQFEGLFIDGRMVCLFSKEGLNDTAHTQGCCCCGGNEVKEAEKVVANTLVYALVE